MKKKQNDAPCLDCALRHPACHQTCPEYAAYKLADAKLKASLKPSAADQYQMEAIKKARRKTRR